MDNKELHLSLKCYKKQKTQQEEEVMKKEKTECSYHRLLFSFLRKKALLSLMKFYVKSFIRLIERECRILFSPFVFIFNILCVLMS